MDLIRSSGVRIGIDPPGDAAAQYWRPLSDRYKMAATAVNDDIDPAFRFMTVDWDGN
jgi:phosphoglucomutase